MMHRRKILLVDDVDFNIEFESKVIQSIIKETNLEIEVDTASSVEEALDKISQNEPYDAMVIDMNLPDGDGVDIAKEALKKDENTRLAALTIYPSLYEHQRAFFDLFLKKPIMPQSYKENFAHLLRI